MLVRFPLIDHPAPVRGLGIQYSKGASYFTAFGATDRECQVLLREVTLCGYVIIYNYGHVHKALLMVRCRMLILILTAMLDRIFYQQWTFPPLQFLYLNIVQSLAVIYGRNDWHYYLTQGYPQLLTTFLPFAMMGIYHASFLPESSKLNKDPILVRPPTRFQFVIVVLFVSLVLSIVSHKEVRFIYPLLPMLHIIGASSLASFCLPIVSHASSLSKNRNAIIRILVLSTLLLLNFLIAIFTTRYHQTASLSVLTYLRQEYSHIHLLGPSSSSHLGHADRTMTVGFLMPCHSTPWRSHLVHPGIKAWALGCEPPVHLNSSSRYAYVDEADQFYKNPEQFLATNLIEQRRSDEWDLVAQNPQQGGMEQASDQEAWDGKVGKKVWPEYLVFFEALEEAIDRMLTEKHYSFCWRGWNSYFHDDWRRRGDVLVWHLEGRT